MKKKVRKNIPEILILLGFISLIIAIGLLIGNVTQDYIEEKRVKQILEDAKNNPSNMEYDIIGILTIPKLDLKLPVLSNCNEELLSISVCRYIGSVEEKPENLVIAGHNSKTCFKKLPKLVLGDEVRFTKLDGTNYYYTVTEIINIFEYEHEKLEKGEWNLTLFTCNSKGDERILVRCLFI